MARNERHLNDNEYTTSNVRPESILHALMQTAPGSPDSVPVADVRPLLDIVAYAAELLTDQEAFIMNAIAFEGITYERLAKRLGVSRTHAWRLYQQTVSRLRYLMVNHKPVRERIGMDPTWNSEAMSELVTIAGSPFNDPIEDTIPVENAVHAVWTHVGSAVDHYDAGLEMNAVKSLTAAAEHAVMYLRSVDEWSLVGMHELLVGKQNDYGHGNILKFGMHGVIVRASDKCERLRNLTKRGVRPRNESLLDSFRDIIGYAVIARMLKAETFELDLAEPDDLLFMEIAA